MTRTMFSGGPARGRLIASATTIALSLLATAPVMSAPSDVCVAARVAAPFRLPDGVLHAAGVLTVCDTRAYSPVADFHVILVDGRRVGMFLSRKRTTEAGIGISPELVFERDAEGRLDLIGYILPASGRAVAYRLRGGGNAWATNETAGGADAGGVGAILTVASTRMR